VVLQITILLYQELVVLIPTVMVVVLVVGLVLMTLLEMAAALVRLDILEMAVMPLAGLAPAVKLAPQALVVAEAVVELTQAVVVLVFTAKVLMARLGLA
jgi:hypothetical protein